MKFEFKCVDCDAEYKITANYTPEFCPYCKEPSKSESEDDEDSSDNSYTDSWGDQDD